MEKASGRCTVVSRSVYVAARLLRAPGRRRDGFNPAGGEHRDLPGQRPGVSLENEQVDAGKRALNPAGIERLVLSAHNALSGRRLWHLVGVEQIFVELLAGARAHDLDRDVPLR